MGTLAEMLATPLTIWCVPAASALLLAARREKSSTDVGGDALVSCGMSPAVGSSAGRSNVMDLASVWCCPGGGVVPVSGAMSSGSGLVGNGSIGPNGEKLEWRPRMLWL